MRTCPESDSGMSRSTISKSVSGLEICATFIGATGGFDATLKVAMCPPNADLWRLPRRCERDLRPHPAPEPSVASVPAVFRVRVWQTTSRGRGQEGGPPLPEGAKVAYPLPVQILPRHSEPRHSEPSGLLAQGHAPFLVHSLTPRCRLIVPSPPKPWSGRPDTGRAGRAWLC